MKLPKIKGQFWIEGASQASVVQVKAETRDHVSTHSLNFLFVSEEEVRDESEKDAATACEESHHRESEEASKFD